MPDILDFVQRLLLARSISYTGKRASLLASFVAEEESIDAFDKILINQDILIHRFMKKVKIFDIINMHLQIPNATVNKYYECKIDLEKLGNNEIEYTGIKDIELYGLEYSKEKGVLSGIPIKSGDFKLSFLFRMIGENENEPLHVKPISFIINADPKSLWNDIPSAENKDDEWKIKKYWKPDTIEDFQPLGDKHIVVASKRGRSHANVGSFRDDDYAFKHFEETGWSIVCVADGAGSARLSRQGSKIACQGIIDYFEENLKGDDFIQFDALIEEYSLNAGDEIQKKLNLFLYTNLGKAAFSVHKKLEEFANKLECSIKDLHSTLIFSLFRKYEFGYAILTFGVGDCPIGLLNKDLSEIKLMNWLDVGEFGGGTRFITMPEIFSSDKFQTRFGFKLIKDFSYLILMTDGIYDPKFIVEANLEKLDKWKEFLGDLGGNNEENIKIEFTASDTEIAHKLSSWMDFWSPGNHDDRTLAIVF